MSPRRAEWAGALCGGLTLALALPGGALDALPALARLVLATAAGAVVLGVGVRAPSRGWARVWLGCGVAGAVSGAWLPASVQGFAPVGPWVAAAVYAVATLAQGAALALPMVLALRVARRRVGQLVWAYPLAVFLFEGLQGSTGLQLPLLSLGLTTLDLPGAGSLASVTGGAGLSAAVAALAAAAVVGWMGGRRAALAAVAAVTVLSGVGVAVGVTSRCPGTLVRVGAVQGGLLDRPEVVTAPNPRRAILAGYEHQDAAVAKAGAELVVWPEQAYPFRFAGAKPPRNLTPASHARLVGLVRHGRCPSGACDFNSVALVVGDHLAGVYDKQALVPVAEGTLGDLTPGHGPVTLDAGDQRLGVLICFESLFSQAVAQRVAQGAELLVNPVSDSFHSVAAGAVQHLAISRLRAMEVGRPLVRASTLMSSALIASDGSVAAVALEGQAGLVADLAVSGAAAPHLVLRHVLPWTLVLLVLTAVVTVVTRRGRRRHDQGVPHV